MSTLRVNEIFYSIQGESSRSGLPTIFIRLTGCPMRCSYCDTAYAFHEGTNQKISEIIESIKKFSTKYVTVTGGEPLAQKGCFKLLDDLSKSGYQVSLETGGAIDVGPVNPKVKIILDVKTPKSGESENNLWENLEKIKKNDEIKFVIEDKDDFSWSHQIIRKYQLNQHHYLCKKEYYKYF